VLFQDWHEVGNESLALVRRKTPRRSRAKRAEKVRDKLRRFGVLCWFRRCGLWCAYWHAAKRHRVGKACPRWTTPKGVFRAIPLA
jgi:hypothetical protein